MCVCVSESVCEAEISRVNYSPEHVETHLSYNRKLQHRRKKKQKEKKGRLTKREKWKTHTERESEKVCVFFALKTHTHAHSFHKKAAFPPGLFVAGQEFKELQLLLNLKIYLTRSEVSLFLSVSFFFFFQSVLERWGVEGCRWSRTFEGRKLRV